LEPVLTGFDIALPPFFIGAWAKPRLHIRPKGYISKLPLPVFTAVSILCTSCGTKFWVIEQNRKYLLGDYFRLKKLLGILLPS